MMEFISTRYPETLTAPETPEYFRKPIMASENNEKPHAGSAGGTGGAASHPAPRDAAPSEPPEGTPTHGGGQVEIPLGVPVSIDEWNDLKESARRSARVDEDADKGPAGQAQQDTGPDDH